MTDAEFERAFRHLLAKGIIRSCGLEGGEMLYELTPDSQLSDEAKAYAAYLDDLDNAGRAN
jgi:hypothetical protein